MKIGTTIVIGAGGIGSSLIPQLSRLLRYHENVSKTHVLHVVDGDMVEEGNLARQNFAGTMVGANKATAILNSIAGEGKVVPRFISTVDDAAGLMVRARGTDKENVVLVVLCVDNDATRRLFYDAMTDIPAGMRVIIVDAANEQVTASVTTSIWAERKCILPVTPVEKYANLRSPADRVPGGGCMEMAPSAPQLLVANFAAAFLALLTIQAILDGHPVAEDVACKIRDFIVAPTGAMLA